ncbi:hypothetical protein LZ554_009004 [Drepanopeziza brunnea f. sp. 'monogermtubi']|nr:hypothetical protein LZ554_009004 [Drepanopeziza brunnea f. sp. 'monogermtubi']
MAATIAEKDTWTATNRKDIKANFSIHTDREPDSDTTSLIPTARLSPLTHEFPENLPLDVYGWSLPRIGLPSLTALHRALTKQYIKNERILQMQDAEKELGSRSEESLSWKKAAELEESLKAQKYEIGDLIEELKQGVEAEEEVVGCGQEEGAKGIAA